MDEKTSALLNMPLKRCLKFSIQGQCMMAQYGNYDNTTNIKPCITLFAMTDQTKGN